MRDISDICFVFVQGRRTLGSVVNGIWQWLGNCLADFQEAGAVTSPCLRDSAEPLAAGQSCAVHVEDRDWLSTVPDATVEGAMSLLASTVKSPGCYPGAELPGHFLRDGHSLFSALFSCPMAVLTSCLILTFKHITVLTFVPLFLFLLHQCRK